MHHLTIMGVILSGKRALSRMISIAFISSEVLFAQQRTFYVSATGSDLNNGLDIASPFMSVARGINAASAGDTIYLLPGTYREMVKVLQRKGIAERPLCIYGYYGSAGLRPVIDGGAAIPSNNNSTNSWMSIEGSDWIEIANIEFRSGWTNPIRVVSSSYLTFNGCYFYGGKKVISATGSSTHHLLVQNCYWDQGGEYLWRLVTDPAGNDAWTSMHEGLLQYYNGSLVDLTGTGGSVVIRNNTIINAFNGIRWSARKGYDTNIEIYDNYVAHIRDNDFEPEYYAFNLHIYHNRSHNIHRTMSVDHVQGGDIYYYGNCITSDTDSWSNQVCTGFWKVYGAGADNLTYPMYAFNNSFCGVGKVFSMAVGTIAVQVKHYNNAYYLTGNRSWILDSVDSTDVFDFDISNKSWPANIVGQSQEQHGVVDDVRFVDSRNFDMRLMPTSPAIDRGTKMSFPEFGWTQSSNGSDPDLGAYEGDDLQEGPPFRFRLLPGMSVMYAEKPRIVRSRISGNSLSFSFSGPLDPATVSASAITLTEQGIPINIIRTSLSDDNYQMNVEIDPSHEIDAGLLAVTFNPPPKGTNGENATLWAASLPSYKKPIATTVPYSRSAKKTERALSLDVYPDPLNGQQRVSFRIPPSFAGAQVAVFRIYDILGRKLKQETHSPLRDGIEFSMNVDRLVTGTYFAVVEIGDQAISKKFIVLK